MAIWRVAARELRVSRQARSIKMELILERSRKAPNIMNLNRSTSPMPIGDAARLIEQEKMFSDDDVESEARAF